MDLQTAAVAHRLGELRRLAGVLRLERRVRSARHGSRSRTLRIALGRRLVALADVLFDGTGVRAHVAGR